MTRKFVTLESHGGNDFVNAHWAWYYINKWYITTLLKLGLPIMSLSVSPPVAPTWVHGNERWGGDLPALPHGELLLFKEYLKRGGGFVYYESNYNTPNEWFPGFTESTRKLEDIINSSCKRLTEPFNPFTGVYEDLSSAGGEPYGIDAAHQYIGDLGELGQVKAVINGQSNSSCWANYLCGVERHEYAGSINLSPDRLDEGWLSLYSDLFNEVPFFWLAGLQCIIPFRNAPNVGINHQHLTDADQGQRNWESKTPLERATFAIDWLMNSDELEFVRVGTFLVGKDMYFDKDWAASAIGDFFNKDVDWRHCKIPGTVTPYKPQNLSEARHIDAMMGTDTQLYGKWKEYMQELFEYLNTIRRTYANVELFSDATSRKMIKQQYHGEVITLSHEKVIDMSEYLANKTANWQINEDEWDDTVHLVTRPPDFVKLTYDSVNEFYTLAEAWWIMLRALYLIATNEGLTTLPDIQMKPVVGPCQPDFCPTTNNENLPTDSPVRVNVWWQHNEYNNKVLEFSAIKNAVLGLFPNAVTDPIGPTYPTDRQVRLPKVLTPWTLLDDNGDPVLANAAEWLYILAQALVNWDTNKTTPADVNFLPSHVLPKLFYVYCQHAQVQNPFGTDVDSQNRWFDLGQRWTLKPAVLKPEYT
jgi:hypothetical protein